MTFIRKFRQAAPRPTSSTQATRRSAIHCMHSVWMKAIAMLCSPTAEATRLLLWQHDSLMLSKSG